MKTIEFEQNEYTERYEDYLLSELLKSCNQELMFLEPKVVNVDGEDVLVANPSVKAGNRVMRLQALWSRNLVTPQDKDAIESFDAVDAVVRFGIFTDEATGEATVAALPKIICLLDSNRKPLRLHGEKHTFKEQ